MHPDRDDFVQTMTAEEQAAFERHAQWLRGMFNEGMLVVSGPCLGRVNTGVVIFEASDQAAAERIVADEPVTRDGHMRGDLQPFRVGHLRLQH